MKYLKTTLVLILVLTISYSCKDESASTKKEVAKQWFKGNLHTHSYWSDGDEFPEPIFDWYKSQNYHFLALTDHNTLAEGDKWIEIKEDSVYQNAFKKYLDTYGADWVEYKIDSGKTLVKLKTYTEYKSKFEEPGKFLAIQSEEITDSFDGKPLHMNATNLEYKIDPSGGGNVAEVLQNNLDQVLKQRKETGTLMFPHVNHPNFGYGVALEDMISLKGERFFEVYNGHPMVHNMGDSVHISTEIMWDLINISYLRDKKPIMFGLATDDSHHYHRKGSEWSNAGRGWVMVQADTLSAKSLITAMESGDFYASTGVELQKIDAVARELSIEVIPETNVTYTLDFIGCMKGDSESKVLKSIKGNSGNYKMPDDLLFVRCKVTSSKKQDNPIEDIIYEMAWTQPILGSK
ncbi:PHP domain-containing protein [Maribacter sp. HTCC2170]|uniref:PHP domain-containing protein n=1 Tax=Maribacter sp. (strain HTCC2170 / KCCM 42371) TaxID=313603 RepID=UPI0002D557CE|nr:histidinol-phosphatase [Maribacter sp. HTCC2170]